MDLKRKTQSFTMVGKAKLNDFTFKIDERSDSNFIYNSLNLNVYCGEKHGSIGVEMMGGYNALNPMDIYAHGKKDDGLDDFDDKIMVRWDQRFDENILSQLGELCFIKVALEKDATGKNIVKKFLSPYDAIKYIKDNLTNDTVVYAKGTLSYSPYEDNVRQHKRVNAIYLSDKEEKDFSAKFKQTILLDKDSSKLENVDKDKMVLNVQARVVDRVKNYKDSTYTGLVAMPYTLEFPIDLENLDKTKSMLDFLFRVKRDITELTVEGDLVEGGKVSEVKYEDLDPDIKTLVDYGVLTLEEAQAKYTDGSKERRMIITAPLTRQEEVNGVKQIVIDKTEEKYKEEDLIIDLSKYQNNQQPTQTVAEPQEMKTQEIKEIDIASLFG